MQPTITCKQCGVRISLDEALLHEIKEEAFQEITQDHQKQLKLKEAEIRQEVEKQSAQEIELVKAKTSQEVSKKLQQQLQTLQDNLSSEKKDKKELHDQLINLMQQLREANKANDRAELEMQKKLNEETSKIREETSKTLAEKYGLQNAELIKQLADTKKALQEANRKAAQGSQQNQGEVLELQLEAQLREEFPLDEIVEVKKGQRGADIKQVVKNQSLGSCGLLLWETKNGKWQPSWIPKFKQDMRSDGASIGVIVSLEIPEDYGDMKQLSSNIWVVKPRLAVVLAYALRGTILQVDSANKMNSNKDAKLEALYQFLVGPEFRHRIEAIVDNYSLIQDEIEKEKRASQLRWARQEKSIRAVIDNTIGMYGDLQGITNRALPGIKSLELEVNEED